MKRITFRSLTLVAALAMIGCQSAPKFAWWKQDKVAENSAVAANSKPPALPSTQSTPQAVAVVGATPPASSVAATPATGATGKPLSAPVAATSPPPLSIPVTSPAAVASTTPPAYSVENSLADKLVSTPNSKSSPTPGATSLAAAPSTPPMATAGPYDPSAYKPTATTASSDAINNTLDADRYAMSSGSASSQPPVSTRTVVSPPTTRSQSLASDPADRYGSRTSTTPNPMPGQTALTDPAALAADRYANPSIPSLAGATSQPAPAAVPSATASPAIKLTAAAGQYRPGGTSTYTATSAATSPVEIASRPAAPTTTESAPAAGVGSQPWAPSGGETVPPARPY